MATHVSAAPRRGFPWVMLAVLILVVALVGVAFAAGRNSTPNQPAATVQARSNLDPRFTHMMPWMRTHIGDIAWMQSHMGDVTWMRSHWDRWQWMQRHNGDVRWMQTHPDEWRWMQGHMGDIGWMHDHWGLWDNWHSGMMGSGNYTGGASHGPSGGWTGPSTGWNGPGTGMGSGMGMGW